MRKMMKLGVCEEHFMFDQFDDDRKVKRNAYPNKITQQEVDVGMPIVSYDSDSDPEIIISKRKKPSAPAPQEMDSDSAVKRKIPKRNKQSTVVLDKTEIKIEYEEICRLCLATGVKMFSLNSEPLKQYFTFIAPCIDEWEMFPSENFPTAVCYLCTNSLKTCYDFGKLCAQSQSVLTEYYLIYSKINTVSIREFHRNELKLHRNLNKHSLPSVFIDPGNENQNQHVLDSRRKKLRPSNSNLVLIKSDLADKSPKIEEVKKEVVYDVSNDFGFGEMETPKHISLHEVLIKQDQTSEEYLDEEIVGTNESAPDVETDSIINLPPPNASETHQSVTLHPTIQLPRRFDRVDPAVVPAFGSLSFEEDVNFEQMSSNLGVATTSDYNAKDTESIITMPSNIEQTNEPSTSVTKKAAYTQLQSTESKAAAATVDVSFDDSNKTQEPVTDTPTLSEATISTLKKSVLKSHGEVEVKRMHYQGGDIHVMMVNAEGKEVLLKLSRKADVQPVVNKQPVTTKYQLQKDVKFNKNCWRVHPLTNEEQFLLIRNRQNKQMYIKAPFKCLTCFKSFQHLPSYNSHIEKHDPKSGDFVCRICKMYFEHKTQLLNHERTHSTMYICKMCQHTFYSKIPAKEHQRKHNNKCSICNKQFKYISGFDEHMFNHLQEMPNDTSPPLKADKTIIKKKIIKKNMNSKESASTAGQFMLVTQEGVKNKVDTRRTIKEEIIEETMSSKETTPTAGQLKQKIKNGGDKTNITKQKNLQKSTMYYKNESGELRPFLKHKTINAEPKSMYSKDGICLTAGQIKIIKDRVNRTVIEKPKIQKMSPLTCCNIKFSHKRLYQRHYRAKHPGKACPCIEEPVVCDLCGKFFHRRYLDHHIQTHKASSERQFLCQYCPQVLCTKRGLVLHQIVHSDQRPFKCPKCPKCYKQKAPLKAHLLKCGKKLDEIERPFVCDICGNRFIEKTTLQAHVLALHLGVKQPQQKEWRNQNANKGEF